MTVWDAWRCAQDDKSFLIQENHRAQSGNRLVFADQFGQILKKADEDDDEGTGDAEEEEPGGDGHGHVGEGEHRKIVEQQGAGDRV